MLGSERQGRGTAGWVAAALVVILVGSAGSAPAEADVSLPRVFGDHMVLQQGMPLKVWGKAEPGEQVTVSLAGQQASAAADGQGRWRVEIQPLQAGGGPLTLTAAGKNTVTVNDVLVGEVWVCSGQSNMEWSVNASGDPDRVKAGA